jgi:hypothetical protein
LWDKFKHILFSYQVRTILVCKSENVYLFPFLFGFMGIMDGIWILTLNIYAILINTVLWELQEKEEQLLGEREKTFTIRLNFLINRL